MCFLRRSLPAAAPACESGATIPAPQSRRTRTPGVMRAGGLRRELLAVLVALCGVPGAHTLFGLRGGGSTPGAAGTPPGSPSNATLPAPAAPPPAAGQKARTDNGTGPEQLANPADPYPVPPTLDDLQDYEAWDGGKGELHIIRAVRAPSGDFSFPEGTTVRCASCGPVCALLLGLFLLPTARVQEFGARISTDLMRLLRRRHRCPRIRGAWRASSRSRTPWASTFSA